MDPAADPAAAPAPAAKRSFYSKLTGSVATHPSLALAAIVILVLAVAYLFAKSKGWLGGSSPFAKGAFAPKKKGEAAEEDPELDDLVAEINSD